MTNDGAHTIPYRGSRVDRLEVGHQRTRPARRETPCHLAPRTLAAGGRNRPRQMMRSRGSDHGFELVPDKRERLHETVADLRTRTLCKRAWQRMRERLGFDHLLRMRQSCTVPSAGQRAFAESAQRSRAESPKSRETLESLRGWEVSLARGREGRSYVEDAANAPKASQQVKRKHNPVRWGSAGMRAQGSDGPAWWCLFVAMSVCGCVWGARGGRRAVVCVAARCGADPNTRPEERNG